MLDISSNDIDQLPPLDLPNLERLFLQGNRLCSLADGLFAGLPKLRVLNVSANKLTGISSTIGQLSALERLILNDNHLATIPFEITRLTNLDYLGLERNPLPVHIAKYSVGKLAVKQHLLNIALGFDQKFHDVPLAHVKTEALYFLPLHPVSNS